MPSVDTIAADVRARASDAARAVVSSVDALALVADGLNASERDALAAAYRRALATLTGAEAVPAAPVTPAPAPAVEAPAKPATKPATKPAKRAATPAPAAPVAPAPAGDAVTYTLPDFSVSAEVYGVSVAAIADAITAAGHAGVTVKRVARKGPQRREFTVTATDNGAVHAIAAAYVAELATRTPVAASA
jgi:hypothetical protein